MIPDSDAVRKNVSQATSEDLLDRVTVYRAGIEAEAVQLIERELRRRGIGPEQIEAHAAERSKSTIPLPDGTVVRCIFCDRPAIVQDWGWHRVQGRGFGSLISLLPIYWPRFLSYCAEHRPASVMAGQ